MNILIIFMLLIIIFLFVNSLVNANELDLERVIKLPENDLKPFSRTANNEEELLYINSNLEIISFDGENTFYNKLTGFENNYNDGIFDLAFFDNKTYLYSGINDSPNFFILDQNKIIIDTIYARMPTNFAKIFKNNEELILINNGNFGSRIGTIKDSRYINLKTFEDDNTYSDGIIFENKLIFSMSNIKLIENEILFKNYKLSFDFEKNIIDTIQENNSNLIKFFKSEYGIIELYKINQSQIVLKSYDNNYKYLNEVLFDDVSYFKDVKSHNEYFYFISSDKILVSYNIINNEFIRYDLNLKPYFLNIFKGDLYLTCEDDYLYKVNIDVVNNIKNEKNLSKNKIIISPNPTSDYLSINSNGIIYEIELFDIRGQSVLKSYGNSNQIGIKLPKLPNGVYCLNIKTEKDYFSKKIILNY